MAVTNTDLAINYLRYWYNASNVSKLPSANYIAYPDFIQRVTPGNFLDSIGSSMASIRQDKVQRAFESLAQSEPDAIPGKDEFFNVLAQEVGGFNLDHVTDAVTAGVADSAKTIGSVALFGLSAYALILVGASLLFLIPLLKARSRSAA